MNSVLRRVSQCVFRGYLIEKTVMVAVDFLAAERRVHAASSNGSYGVVFTSRNSNKCLQTAHVLSVPPVVVVVIALLS